MDTLQIYRKNIEIPNLDAFRFLFMLFIPVLLMRFNTGLDILCALFIIFILFQLDLKQLFQAFIFLHLFEESIYIGSTSSVSILVFCPLIAVRLLALFLQKKMYLRKKHLLILGFYLISLLMALLSGTLGRASLVIFMNVLIILMFSITLKQEYSAQEIFETMVKTLLISTTLIIVYGFARFRFYNEARDGIRIPRFMGTYEPNYTAVYMNMGILSALHLKKELGKPLANALLLIHFAALVLTQSTTGIVTLFVVLFFEILRYFIRLFRTFHASLMNKGEQERRITTALYGSLFLILIVSAFGGLYAAGLMNKIIGVVGKIFSGNFDSATSGRIPIMRSFLRNFFYKGNINVFFGNGPQAFKIYTGYFKKFMYSHNTYVDLLYSFGLIGGAAAVLSALVILFRGRFLDENLSGQQKKTLFLMRLMPLIFAAGLAIHAENLTMWMFFL